MACSVKGFISSFASRLLSSSVFVRGPHWCVSFQILCNTLDLYEWKLNLIWLKIKLNPNNKNYLSKTFQETSVLWKYTTSKFSRPQSPKIWGVHTLYIAYYTEVSGHFISSFISFYSFRTFTEKKFVIANIWGFNSFNLSFPHNTILSCFFFFFIIIQLYFLILAMIAQIFNPTAEVVLPTGAQTNEVNAEIETVSNFWN